MFWTVFFNFNEKMSPLIVKNADFDSVSLGWGLGFYIFLKFPGNVNTACLQTALGAASNNVPLAPDVSNFPAPGPLHRLVLFSLESAPWKFPAKMASHPLVFQVFPDHLIQSNLYPLSL